MLKVDLKGLPRAVQIAYAIGRALTWGMPEGARLHIHAEGIADWEAMKSDHSSAAVLARAVRGIPAGIWGRLDFEQATALPAATAVGILGLGGITAGGLDTAYAVPLRLAIVTAGLGALILALVAFASPRRLTRSRLVTPLALAGLGFAGMAEFTPGVAAIVREHPFAETPFDVILSAGFVTTAAGFALLALAAATRGTSQQFHRSGLILIGGLGIFSLGQLVWGMSTVTYDLAIALPSIGAGLAAAAAVHLVPRLRHLEIM